MLQSERTSHVYVAIASRCLTYQDNHLLRLAGMYPLSLIVGEHLSEICTWELCRIFHLGYHCSVPGPDPDNPARLIPLRQGPILGSEVDIDCNPEMNIMLFVPS